MCWSVRGGLGYGESGSAFGFRLPLGFRPVRLSSHFPLVLDLPERERRARGLRVFTRGCGETARVWVRSVPRETPTTPPCLCRMRVSMPVPSSETLRCLDAQIKFGNERPPKPPSLRHRAWIATTVSPSRSIVLVMACANVLLHFGEWLAFLAPYVQLGGSDGWCGFGMRVW